ERTGANFGLTGANFGLAGPNVGPAGANFGLGEQGIRAETQRRRVATSRRSGDAERAAPADWTPGDGKRQQVSAAQLGPRAREARAKQRGARGAPSGAVRLTGHRGWEAPARRCRAARPALAKRAPSNEALGERRAERS